MMSFQDAIPVVDFQGVLDTEDLHKCPQVLELHTAFSQIGFVYLQNHGIKMDVVNRASQVALEFFNLPFSIKRKYLAHVGEDGTGLGGYFKMEQESAGPDAPGDLKENFDVFDIETCKFPDNEVPELRVVLVELYQLAKTCGLKILEVMGHALKLEDPFFFVKRHQATGNKGSFSSARINYYPPIASSMEIKPGQIRCGEHVDYGTITLLFPDPIGGLQVKKRDGGFIDVPYVKDAVLVNLGALMQRWTGDRYIATPHRVMLPNNSNRDRTRQSVAIFMHPDQKELIESVNGSTKYPPIQAYDDTYQRIRETIK